jgi:hypothetical protein
MNKQVMGAPRRRTDVFADLARNSEAIADAPSTPVATPAPEPQPEAAAPTYAPAVAQAEAAAPTYAEPEAAREPAGQLAPQGRPASEVTHFEQSRPGQLDLNAIRAMKPRKEPTIQTNARLPVSLIDDIDLIRSLTGTSATDIITEGTRREVARLKKLHGLE